MAMARQPKRTRRAMRMLDLPTVRLVPEAYWITATQSIRVAAASRPRQPSARSASNGNTPADPGCGEGWRESADSTANRQPHQMEPRLLSIGELRSRHPTDRLDHCLRGRVRLVERHQVEELNDRTIKHQF